MKEYWLAAIAVPLLVVGPAAAADMALRGSESPVVPLSWSGCYTGANVGWVGIRDEITLAPSGNYLDPVGVAPPPNVAGTGLNSRGPALVTNSYSNRISGIEAGPQVGCNWQTGDFVFGGEADIQWTNLNNRVDANFGPIAAANAAFTIAPHTEQVTSRLDWLSTVRARAGTAVEGVLLYVTGGVAIGGLQSDTAVTFGTFPVLPVFNAANHVGSISMTRTGWVAGVGGEYAIDANWSIKAEYLYVDLGAYSYYSPLVAPAGVAAGYSWSTTMRERDQMARIGVNYRWAGLDRASY